MSGHRSEILKLILGGRATFAGSGFAVANDRAGSVQDIDRTVIFVMRHLARFRSSVSALFGCDTSCAVGCLCSPGWRLRGLTSLFGR